MGEFDIFFIITPYIVLIISHFIGWYKNRIKTIKPDPYTFSKNNYCICTMCSYYREHKMDFICMMKKGKIPIEQIRKKHGCFTSEAKFGSVMR